MKIIISTIILMLLTACATEKTPWDYGFNATPNGHLPVIPQPYQPKPLSSLSSDEIRKILNDSGCGHILNGFSKDPSLYIKCNEISQSLDIAKKREAIQKEDAENAKISSTLDDLTKKYSIGK